MGGGHPRLYHTIRGGAYGPGQSLSSKQLACTYHNQGTTVVLIILQLLLPFHKELQQHCGSLDCHVKEVDQEAAMGHLSRPSF